jgi:tetratricopeptide (TPR) repeat protein
MDTLSRAQQERARADQLLSQKDYLTAITAYQKARALYPKTNPEDAQLTHERAQVEYHLGFSLQQTNQMQEAREAYQNAEELFHQSQRVAPSDETRINAAKTAQNLSAVTHELDETQASLDASKRGLLLYEELFEEGYVEHLVGIAWMQHHLATALWYDQQKEAAIQEERRAVRFFTELVREWRRADLDHALEAATCNLKSMGGDNTETASPKFQEASALYQKSLAATQRGDLIAAKLVLLTAQDAFAALLQEEFLEETARMVAVINNHLGALSIEAENFIEAAECFQFAKEVLEELRQKFQRFDVIEMLALVEHNLADTHRALQRYQDALGGYERSQHTREALLTRANRLDLLDVYALSQYQAGLCLFQLGEKNQAIRLHEAAKQNYLSLIAKGRAELYHHLQTIDENLAAMSA